MSKRRVWIKQGVRGRLTREAQRGLGKLVVLYFTMGKDYFITSLEEGSHMPGSFHYTGDGWDGLRQGVRVSVIRETLGPDFDVIDYGDYCHHEYDPKPDKPEFSQLP